MNECVIRHSLIATATHSQWRRKNKKKHKIICSDYSCISHCDNEMQNCFGILTRFDRMLTCLRCTHFDDWWSLWRWWWWWCRRRRNFKSTKCQRNICGIFMFASCELPQEKTHTHTHAAQFQIISQLCDLVSNLVSLVVCVFCFCFWKVGNKILSQMKTIKENN